MLVRIPFVIVAAVLAAATLGVAAARLSDPVALNPWEPAIAMEAVRLNSGLPVYEVSHATHMYGPLLTVLIAAVFRVTGLNLLAARIVLSLLAIALATFLALVFSRDRSRAGIALAALLFLAASFRTNLIFFTAQPDCVAFLCASVALYFWAGHKFVVSIPLLIAATLFKQTAAAFALVPMVFCVMWERPLQLRRVALSVMPALAILVTFVGIYAIAPQMFHAVVTVPASIKVYPERAPGMLLYLVGTFPLLFLAALALRSRALDPRDQWSLAAIVVLVPASIWTICKAGGSYNSFLPAYLAMIALFVARADVVREWLGSFNQAKTAAAAAGVALIILLSFGVQFQRDFALLNARSGDERYDTAVKVAAASHAISPQDPTIAYRAHGYIGRSLFFELDAHAVNGNWPDKLPGAIEQEMGNASSIVTVQSYVPTPQVERGLSEQNWQRGDVAALRDSVYALWTRAGP